MPLYEHVFLARQDISTQQVEALTKEFAQVIDEAGGKVGKTEYWGLKSLSHKIKKNRKAHYTLMNLDAPPAAVAEMERRMGISTDIIRFLTIRVEQHETEPSAQMRKSDRDERGDRGGFRGDRGGFRGGGGFRGDRGPREGGGFRSDRGPREGGGFRSDRGPRPDRDDARPPRPLAGSETE
ncbi:MAG: 30S ribosomal protein S6 [Bacteroidota bacterium]|jgi:small subunit ribosomal protein S6